MMRLSMAFNFDLTEADKKTVKVGLTVDATTMYGFEIQIPSPIGMFSIGAYITLGTSKDIMPNVQELLGKDYVEEDDSPELELVRNDEDGFVPQTEICAMCMNFMASLRANGKTSECSSLAPKDQVTCKWAKQAIDFALPRGVKKDNFRTRFNQWLQMQYQDDEYQMLDCAGKKKSPLRFPLTTMGVSSIAKCAEQFLERLNYLQENPTDNNICKELLQICQPPVEADPDLLDDLRQESTAKTKAKVADTAAISKTGKTKAKVADDSSTDDSSTAAISKPARKR
jgi:hypothetical protein